MFKDLNVILFRHYFPTLILLYLPTYLPNLLRPSIHIGGQGTNFCKTQIPQLRICSVKMIFTIYISVSFHLQRQNIPNKSPGGPGVPGTCPTFTPCHLHYRTCKIEIIYIIYITVYLKLLKVKYLHIKIINYVRVINASVKILNNKVLRPGRWGHF